MASKRVNELLLSDDIIIRWHIEIDGDENGIYLTAINLLSYFQFPVGDLKSLNEVQNYVSRKLAHLLSRANRVIKVADKSVVVVARSEEHTSELQSRGHLVCRLLLEKKNI